MNRYRQSYRPQPSEIYTARRPRKGCRNLFLLALVIVCTIMGFLFWKTLTAAKAATMPETAQEETEATAQDLKNVCGLKDVSCPEEGERGTFTLTAYTSRPEETDDTPCIAADGSDICKRHAKGETICASNDFKLGTKLTLQAGSKTINCTVRDRMNRRYTGKARIDVYFGHDLKGARAFGIQEADVSQI